MASGRSQEWKKHDPIAEVGLVGTFGYMAPEVLALDIKSATADKLDTYSLGCMLFLLLSGHSPWPVGVRPEADDRAALLE